MDSYKTIAKDLAEDIICAYPIIEHGKTICPFCRCSGESSLDLFSIEHNKNCPFNKARQFLKEIEKENEI